MFNEKRGLCIAQKRDCLVKHAGFERMQPIMNMVSGDLSQNVAQSTRIPTLGEALLTIPIS